LLERYEKPSAFKRSAGKEGSSLRHIRKNETHWRDESEKEKNRHPLNDNNTQEALEGLIKAVETSVEQDKEKQKQRQNDQKKRED
jgi:hypothetical protein